MSLRVMLKIVNAALKAKDKKIGVMAPQDQALEPRGLYHCFKTKNKS